MAGFTIPNTPDAYNQNQAEPDSLDFQILGNQTNAVVTGAQVTPGPSGATVAVSAGEVIVNGVYYPVTASTSLALTAYASSPFFDIVVARLSSGSISLVVLAGTSGANPVYPAITDNDVVLAAVWRPSNTTPTTNMIVDKRLMVPSTPNRVASGNPSAGTGSNGDVYVNSSWTADATLAGPLSVKVGGTWYQLARYSNNFTAGTITANLTGTASNATLAAKASTLSQGGGNGTAMTFNWSGQSGQPTWLWGSNDGTNHYVYNPSNFNVDRAKNLVTSANNLLLSYNETFLANRVYSHTNFSPSVDNAFGCGEAGGPPFGNAWLGVWAYNFVTSSDERLKKDIEPTNIGLDFINKLNPVSYKFIVGSRTVISDESAVDNPGIRPHYGFVAQDVKQVMDELGLEDFGGWGLADKNDPDSTQTLRLMEFIAPMVKAIQELSARLDALEAGNG